MSYAGTTGAVSALYRPDGGVPTIGPSAHLVATGSVTNQQFGLFRWEMAPGQGGPSAHFHRTFSESFYVLGGTIRLFNGEKWIDATSGDFLYVPEGGIHAFENGGDEPASMLILFAPGIAREEYFQELADVAASGRTLSEDEWTDLYRRHDQYMVAD